MITAPKALSWVSRPMRTTTQWVVSVSLSSTSAWHNGNFPLLPSPVCPSLCASSFSYHKPGHGHFPARLVTEKPVSPQTPPWWVASSCPSHHHGRPIRASSAVCPHPVISMVVSGLTHQPPSKSPGSHPLYSQQWGYSEISTWKYNQRIQSTILSVAGDIKYLFCNSSWVPTREECLIIQHDFSFSPTRLEDTVMLNFFNFWLRPPCSSFSRSLLFLEVLTGSPLSAVPRDSERSLHCLSYLPGSQIPPLTPDLAPVSIPSHQWPCVGNASNVCPYRCPVWENWEPCWFLVCRGLAQSSQLLTRVSECSSCADACLTPCVTEHVCEERVGEHTPWDSWANGRHVRVETQETPGSCRWG